MVLRCREPLEASKQTSSAPRTARDAQPMGHRSDRSCGKTFSAQPRQHGKFPLASHPCRLARMARRIPHRTLRRLRRLRGCDLDPPRAHSSRGDHAHAQHRPARPRRCRHTRARNRQSLKRSPAQLARRIHPPSHRLARIHARHLPPPRPHDPPRKFLELRSPDARRILHRHHRHRTRRPCDPPSPARRLLPPHRATHDPRQFHAALPHQAR